MSTSLLYHAWGLRGYRLEATDFAEGVTVFRVRQNAETLCCGHCGGRDVMREGVVVRRFRALPSAESPCGWNCQSSGSGAPSATRPAR